MQQANDINQLLGRFLDLQEQWEDDPENFNWEALGALASGGAQLYNEGNGRSFQILCTDGMQHGEFHLRFLEYSVAAGFDPFKLVRTGSGETVTAAFGHESLANAAQDNLWSRKMQARLQDLARIRFGTAEDIDETHFSHAVLTRIIACCRDSIPDDVLERLSAALLQPS